MKRLVPILSFFMLVTSCSVMMDNFTHPKEPVFISGAELYPIQYYTSKDLGKQVLVPANRKRTDKGALRKECVVTISQSAYDFFKDTLHTLQQKFGDTNSYAIRTTAYQVWSFSEKEIQTTLSKKSIERIDAVARELKNEDSGTYRILVSTNIKK